MKRRLSCIFLLAVLASVLRPASAFAEFQVRGAIDDPANETISGLGQTRTSTFSARDGGWFMMLSGQRYNIEVSGVFNYSSAGPKYLADAECSTYGADNGWQAQRFTGLYNSDLLDLKLRGDADTSFDWAPVQPFTNGSGESACSSTHTYTTTFTSNSRSSLYVYFWVHDTDPQDNNGDFTVRITRGPYSNIRVVDGNAYQCPKWTEEAPVDTAERAGEIQTADMTIDSFTWGAVGSAGEKDALGNHIHPYWYQTGHFGLFTCNWALPDSVYKITVSGTWQYDNSSLPPLNMADAECTTGPADSQWLVERYAADPRNISTGWTDYMDTYINGVNFNWVPNKPDITGLCSTDHIYTLLWSPVNPGPILFNIYDFSYQELNNTGQMSIKVEKVK